MDISARKAAFVSVLSGLSLALCWPRPGLCLLAWIGLAPLFLTLARVPARNSFLLGWLAGGAFHGLAFYWIYSTCRFAQTPLPVAVLAWAALAAFQGLAWGMAAAFGRWTTPRLPPSLRALGWALAWTACAVAWERWTPRLPADLLEYSQWRFLPMLQIASLGGPHILGFVIAFFNAALAQVWSGEKEGKKALAAGTALAGAVLIYGIWCLDARPTRPGPVARVEILQPAIDQYAKWDERYRAAIQETLRDLMWRRRATAMPRMVVWPEATLPGFVREGSVPAIAGLGALRTTAAQYVGVITKRDAGETLNSILVVGPDAKFRAIYHKRELVPFGEYIPFEGWLRPLIGKLNELGGITAGDPGQPLLDTPWGPAAGSICYEAVFPRWARRDARRGARLIVNVTNDGWYKDTWGPYQHFLGPMMRAVENRLTVLRAGNTGISAVIDPWGVTLARLDLGARGRLEADVPLADAFPSRSFYARHGDWFGTLCLAAAVLMAVFTALSAGTSLSAPGASAPIRSQ